MAGISQQKQTYSDTVNQKSKQGPCLAIGMQLFLSFPSAEGPKIYIGCYFLIRGLFDIWDYWTKDILKNHHIKSLIYIVTSGDLYTILLSKDKGLKVNPKKHVQNYLLYCECNTEVKLTKGDS